MPGVPYTFANATASIPLAYLDTNFATTATLGSTPIGLGNTTTTVNSLTVTNFTISSLASTLPNSFLANSSVSIGNATITLGAATTTTIGNLILANGTVNNVLIAGPTTVRTVTFPDANGTVVTANNTVTINTGYSVSPYNLGTVSANITLGMSNGNYQYMTANAAFTITAPTSDGAIDVLVTNGAGAGTISFSGFTVGSSTGSTYATTNANKYILSVRRINAVSTYSWYALQ